MKIRFTAEIGTARIDFARGEIQSAAMQEIYDYFMLGRTRSKVYWSDDPFLLRNGIVIGDSNLWKH